MCGDNRSRTSELTIFRLNVESYLRGSMRWNNGGRDGRGRTSATYLRRFKAERERMRVFYPERVCKSGSSRDCTTIIYVTADDMNVRQYTVLVYLPQSIPSRNRGNNGQESD